MADLNKFPSVEGTSSNTGSKKLKIDNQSIPTQLFILPSDFAPISRVNALLIATWNAMQWADTASRGYVTPYCNDAVELTPEAPTYTPKTTGVPERMSEFAPAWNMVMGKENEALYHNLLNFDGATVKVAIGDKNGNIKMCQVGDLLDGFEAKLEVSMRKLSTGDNHAEFMIKVTLADASKWKRNCVVLQTAELDTPFSLRDFDGVYDCDVNLIGTPTASSITVQVNLSSWEQASAKGQINGLSQATPKVDFRYNALTAGITSATALGEGKYTLAGTFANAGIISLNKTSLLSNKAIIALDNINPLTIVGIV